MVKLFIKQAKILPKAVGLIVSGLLQFADSRHNGCSVLFSSKIYLLCYDVGHVNLGLVAQLFSAPCRAERHRAAEIEEALQRAQRHILDLQEQHQLDVSACRRQHAADTMKLRTDCCSVETELAQLRQALCVYPSDACFT